MPGPDTLKLLENAISGGAVSASWVTLGVAVVLTLLLWYVGSYLKRKGEDIAVNQKKVLEQLEEQTKVTAKVTEEIHHQFEVQLEQIRSHIASLQAQENFLRELYAPGVKEYSSEQARALRQAYLLLFEPHSSDVEVEKDFEDFEKRLDMATQVVMQPLREYVGLLDESTIKKIYSVRRELSKLKGRTPGELKRRKNDFFNVTEVARQYVKADKIALRLGLINRPLEERRPDEE